MPLPTIPYRPPRLPEDEMRRRGTDLGLLRRPENERPMCLFPVGYPAADCVVPDLHRKPLSEVMVEV